MVANKSLGTLTLDMVLKTGGFVSGLDKAARESEKRMKRIKDTATSVGKFAGAALVGIGTGLAFLTKNAIDTADEVSKLAQKTGVSTEAISELQYAAGLSGVDDLGASLIKFNRSISEAAQGSKEQAEAFKALGVNVKNVDGSLKTTEQLFTETAEAFAGFSDGANKSAVAMQLFGKSGAQLIPLLNAGAKGLAEMRAEAAALGLTIDEKTGKAAEQFNDNLDRLKAVSTGLGTRLANELAPTLEKVTDYLVGVAKEGDAVGTALEGIRAGVGVIVVPLTGLWNLLQTIVQAFVAVGAAAGAIARRDFAALEEIGNAFGEDRKRNIEDVTKAYELFFGELGKGTSAIEKAKEAGKDLILPGAEDDKAAEELRKAQQAVTDYLAALGEEIAVNGASRAQLEARKLALMGATEAQQEQAFRLGEYLTILDEQKQSEQEAAAVFDSTRTAAEKYAEELKKLSEFRGRGLINDETFTRKTAILESSRLLSQLADEQAEFARQQQALDIAVQTGLLSRTQAEEGLVTVTREAIAQQSKLADELERVATASGDADLLSRVQDLRAELAGLDADVSKTFGERFRQAFEDAAPQIDKLAEQLGGTLGGALSELNQGIGDIAANTLLWGEGGTEAMQELGRSIITDVVSSLIRAGAQMAANFLLQQAGIAATTAAAVAGQQTVAAGSVVASAEIATAAAPAAALTSLASFGANAGFALAGIAAVLAATKLLGGFAEGGFTGMGGLGEVAGVVHGQEGVVSASALRAAANAINDPDFWSGNGSMQLEVRNMGEPMDIRVERVGRRLIQTMTPAIIDATDSAIGAGISSGLGRTGQAIGATYGSQRSSQR